MFQKIVCTKSHHKSTYLIDIIIYFIYSADPKYDKLTFNLDHFKGAGQEVLETVMKEGLEHHYGIAYGGLRLPLNMLAKQLDLPVFELT